MQSVLSTSSLSPVPSPMSTRRERRPLRSPPATGGCGHPGRRWRPRSRALARRSRGLSATAPDRRQLGPGSARSGMSQLADAEPLAGARPRRRGSGRRRCWSPCSARPAAPGSTQHHEGGASTRPPAAHTRRSPGKNRLMRPARSACREQGGRQSRCHRRRARPPGASRPLASQDERAERAPAVPLPGARARPCLGDSVNSMCARLERPSPSSTHPAGWASSLADRAHASAVHEHVHLAPERAPQPHLVLAARGT